VIGAAVTERSITATKALVARWVRIVSAAWRVISSICSRGSGTDGGSTDAYCHSTGYGCTTIDATTIDATASNATVINASASNATASSICEGVS
jgi:hypothetical protein